MKRNSFIRNFFILILTFLLSNFLFSMTPNKEFDDFQSEEQELWEKQLDKSKEYNTYVNGAYAFAVDIPTNSKLCFPTNGGGVRWIDTETTFAGAWGSNVIFIESAEEDDFIQSANAENFKKSYKEKIKINKKGLAYHFFKDNTYVVSYVKGNKIFYTKAILNPKEGVVVYIEFQYPKAKQGEMKAMVERASKSLRYLNRN